MTLINGTYHKRKLFFIFIILMTKYSEHKLIDSFSDLLIGVFKLFVLIIFINIKMAQSVQEFHTFTSNLYKVFYFLYILRY